MINKETKVQISGGSLITSLPKYLVDSLSIQKGDKVSWNYDTDTKKLV